MLLSDHFHHHFYYYFSFIADIYIAPLQVGYSKALSTCENTLGSDRRANGRPLTIGRPLLLLFSLHCIVTCKNCICYGNLTLSGGDSPLAIICRHKEN